MQEGNIFNHEGVDPNSDDAANALRILLHALISEESNVDDLDIIIRKNCADNCQPELEDIDTIEIFTRPSNIKVHIDKFVSKFGFNGINFTIEMQKVDWNTSMHAIVSSLQGKNETGPTNDHLDLKVMELANSVNNKFVIRFHKDNFKEFDGTHVHQPNQYIQNLRSYMNDKQNEEYVRTTHRLTNLLENIQGPGAAKTYQMALSTAEKKFAYKVAVSMARTNQRLDNADLVQLKEIDDKIGKATIDQLVELQADLLTMQEKCAGEKRKSRHCKIAYNKLADVFDIDPLLPNLHEEAQETLSLKLRYKVKDRMESVEDLKKDQASLDKLEEECPADKLLTPECQDKVFEYAIIYEIDPTVPTFFADLDKKMDELILKAENKAKAPEAGVGDDANGGDDAQGGDATGGDAQGDAQANPTG